MRKKHWQSRKTLIVFAWSGNGLGHVARAAAIADAYRVLDEEADALIFVPHPAELLRDYKLRYVAVPIYDGMLVGDRWGGWSGSTAEAAFLHSATEVFVGALLDSRHGVVLHDVVVNRALYRWAGFHDVPQVFIERARRDRPDQRGWLLEHAPAVRHVLVPGAKAEPSIDRGLSILGVSSISRLLGTEPVWADPDASALRVAVLAGGGGEPDAASFVGASLAAVARLAASADQRVVVTVVLGPAFRGRLDVPPAAPMEVRVFSYLSARHSPYAETDVAICQAGANTIVELTQSGVPGVVVPGPRWADDQRARAEAFAERNPSIRVAAIDPDEIHDSLQEVVRLRARNGATAVNSEEATGAREAAEYLLALAEGRLEVGPSPSGVSRPARS